MSSNGTKGNGTQDPLLISIYHHPVLVEFHEREGQYGTFHNFTLMRPFLDQETAESKKSFFLTLNRATVDALGWVVDDLKEKLAIQEAALKSKLAKNGSTRRATKKKGSSRAAASR